MITREWIRATCYWLFGFYPQPFQLDILEAVLNGGIFSILIPTDHGKTSMIRVAVVLKLVWNAEHEEQLGNHLIIKASDQGAHEMLGVIYNKLILAGSKYPTLLPIRVDLKKLAAEQQQEPRGLTAGIRCMGYDQGNPNPTVFASSMGARDLQGRRGDTYIDDVETMNEAVYQAYRVRLEQRVMSTLRTLEDRPDALWSMWGTPYADDCLTEDSEVQMANGSLMPIRDVEVGDRVLALNGDWRLEPAAVLWKGRKVKPVYRVTLEGQHAIKASAEHRVLTFEGWRRVGELSPGDYLTVPRRLPAGIGTLRRDDAVLLAAWIAEGAKHMTSFLFTNTNTEVIAEVRAIADRRGWKMVGDGGFGWRLSAGRRHKKGSDTPNNLLREYGLKVGWRHKSCSTDAVRIPAAVMQAREDVVAAFLSMLFACDGCATAASLVYATISENLARDVQRLLWRFGVRSSLTVRRRLTGKMKHPAWKVTVADGVSISAFALRIGIVGKQAAVDRLVQRVAERSEKERLKFGNFPPGWFRVLGMPYQYKRGGRIENGGAWVLRGKPDTGWSHRKVAQAAVLAERPEVQAMAEGDVGWYRVLSIEPLGEQPTCDLEIEGLRNFIADNVIVHNSIYFKVQRQLGDIPNAKVFRFPVCDEDGNLLWPARRQKIEMHRRMMSHAEWQVAYELRPISAKPIDKEMIERAKDRDLGYLRSEAELVAFVRRLQPPPEPEILPAMSLTRAPRIVDVPRLYIGWDPSAVGDFAICVVLYLGDHLYLIDTFLRSGDAMEQIQIVVGLVSRYPTATVVVERNNVQRILIELLSERIPRTLVVAHETTGNKNSDQIGIPAMLDLLRSGQFHLPWADNEAQNVSHPAIEELTVYSATAHPHLLPAIWFTHHYDSRAAMKRVEQAQSRATPGQRYFEVMQERADRAWEGGSWGN